MRSSPFGEPIAMIFCHRASRSSRASIDVSPVTRQPLASLGILQDWLKEY